MKYKVIKLIRRVNVKFEGVVMEDEKGKQYITTGVMKWEATPERMEQCNVVNSINREKFLSYWNENFPYDELIFENENFIEIKDCEQFFEIRDSQNAQELCTRSEVAEIVEKFKAENKPYTIFSHQDANDGSPWYLTYGIKCCNNIGYYVLEGNFTLPNDIDL